MENFEKETVTTATVTTGAKVEAPQSAVQSAPQSAVQPVQQPAVQSAPTVQTPAQQSVSTVAPPDKATRFKSRAEAQTSRIMAEIKRMNKLTNRKYYAYTPEQIDELFGAIQQSLDEVKASFTTGTIEKKKLFTFSK